MLLNPTCWNYSIVSITFRSHPWSCCHQPNNICQIKTLYFYIKIWYSFFSSKNMSSEIISSCTFQFWTKNVTASSWQSVFNVQQRSAEISWAQWSYSCCCSYLVRDHQTMIRSDWFFSVSKENTTQYSSKVLSSARFRWTGESPPKTCDCLMHSVCKTQVYLC